MADITMCNGERILSNGMVNTITLCKVKDKCYRHTAKPSEYQYWFVAPPFLINGSCEMYWENTNGSKGNKEKPVSEMREDGKGSKEG